MNEPPPTASALGPVPRPFEAVAFWIAVAVGTLAALFGVAGVYDATKSSASREWSGPGVLAMMIVDVPAGLVVFSMGFTQRSLNRRVILAMIGFLVLALPVRAARELQHRHAKQKHEMEERTLKRTRELKDDNAK